MKQNEFIEFLKTIGLVSDVSGSVIYKEHQKENIITQSVYLRSSFAVSLNLTIVNKQLIEKNIVIGLYDGDVKNKFINEILDFYDKHGVMTKNMIPFVRERKISEILN